MKKTVFLGVMIIAIVFAVSAMAQVPQAWPDRSGKKPTVLTPEQEKMLKDAPPSPAPLPTNQSDFLLSLNNLSGDFGLVIEKGISTGWAPGIGLDILNDKQGLLTLRAEGFFPNTATYGTSNATVIGGAVLVNLIQLAGMIQGTTWVAQMINPSLGIAGGFDFNNHKFAAIPMISVINYQFK